MRMGTAIAASPNSRMGLRNDMPEGSGEDSLHDAAVDIGEAAIDAVVPDGKFFGVEAEEVENRRAEVVASGFAHVAEEIVPSLGCVHSFVNVTAISIC